MFCFYSKKGIRSPPDHLSDFLAGPPPGVTESRSPSAITDAHFCKKIGTPSVIVVLLPQQEGNHACQQHRNTLPSRSHGALGGITDAHFGKKIGTPSVTVVSLQWREVWGSACENLTRGVLCGILIDSVSLLLSAFAFLCCVLLSCILHASLGSPC